MTPEKTSPKKKTSKKDLERRIDELEIELHLVSEQSAKYLNQLKYLKADLENINKQNQKRLMDIMDRANGELLEKLLPFIDELKIIYSKDADKTKLIEGVRMIHDKLLKLIESEGVTQIKAVGEKFDPYKHEAIMEVETFNVPDGFITDEIRRGYIFKDKVLRASVVKVARAPDIVELEIEDN